VHNSIKTFDLIIHYSLYHSIKIIKIMKKKIQLIVSRDTKYGIGLDGKIPWRCREDMIHFQTVTTTTKNEKKQNAVIMGRRTWESLKNKPLHDRVNICISKNAQMIATCSTLSDAIKYANENTLVENIFIIGGERVFREALSSGIVQTIFMTIIKKEVPTDRDVRFIGKFLNNFKNSSIVKDTSEYIIWRYSL